MNEPMTWGDYMMVEIIVPLSFMLLLAIIPFVAYIRATIQARRSWNAATKDLFEDK